jgi:antitoxin component YwqK of YwqJK toxin-antitoxin module
MKEKLFDMKLTFTLFFTLILFFSSYAQAVVEKSKTQNVEKDGVNITTFDDQPYSGYLVETYQNGKPKTWITMKNGLANGLWQEWLENGNLRYNAYWKAGKGHGLWQYFHDNGSLRYEEAYLDDIPNGISRAYYNNGQLMQDSFWLKGKKHGVWSYYSETGVLLKTEIYDNNELISTTEK